MHGPNLDVLEAARYLGVSRAMLYRLVCAGAITPIHVGRRTLYPTSELDAFIGQRIEDARREPVGAA